jgi:hypothetical protein
MSTNKIPFPLTNLKGTAAILDFDIPNPMKIILPDSILNTYLGSTND